MYVNNKCSIAIIIEYGASKYALPISVQLTLINHQCLDSLHKEANTEPGFFSAPNAASGHITNKPMSLEIIF